MSNTTLLPPGILTRLFAEPLHPGFSLGTSYKYFNTGRHELLQTAKMGYFYHRYTQHAVQLYTELGYRYYTKLGLDLGPLLGGGYLHSIPDTQIFELNGQGEYERKTNLGKPQIMLSSSLEIGYTTSVLSLNQLRFFMAYQFWLQSPFVKQYVPLLPNTALHIGLSVPLRKMTSRNDTN
jgi:hypothetical protein